MHAIDQAYALHEKTLYSPFPFVISGKEYLYISYNNLTIHFNVELFCDLINKSKIIIYLYAPYHE